MEPKLLADGILAIPVIPGTSYKDGAPIAVMMLHTDGSYEVIKTPLTCGDWMKMSYSGGEIRYTKHRNCGRVTYHSNGVFHRYRVRNPYNRIDRLVETEVWSDGRVESRDYVPEGSRYTMLKKSGWAAHCGQCRKRQPDHQRTVVLGYQLEWGRSGT